MRALDVAREYSTRSAMQCEEFGGLETSLAGIASGRIAAVCRQTITALRRRSRWLVETGN